MALVGLEEGILTGSTVFSCGGVWEYGGHPFHCWSKGHGAVDMLTAIQNSCNIYFYHAGDRIGIERLDKWGALFGLGRKTGVDLPGETSGVLGSPAWKKARGMGPWYPGETLPVSIGQGYLTVTPLQLLSFYSTLATGGVALPAPHRLGTPGGAQHRGHLARSPGRGQGRPLARGQRRRNGQGLPDPRLRRLRQNGDRPGRRSQLPGKNTYSLEKGERDHAWFAGFAPRNNPSVAFVVMVEHGGHGGDVGAKNRQGGPGVPLPGQEARRGGWTSRAR